MNRTEMINAYGQNKKLKETLAEISMTFALFKSIAEGELLWDRAKKVIDMANDCMKNGIEIPYRFWKTDCGFLGFSRQGKYDPKRRWNVDSLKIGGRCDIVFYNGEITFPCNQPGTRKESEERIIARFVDDFNQFEKDFYAFVDETITA